MSSKRTWLVVGGVLLGCLCLALIAAAGALGIAAWFLTAPAPPTTAMGTAIRVPATPATLEAQPATPGLQPTGEALLSPEIRAEMDEIQEQVISLRGLQPTGPVERTLLTPDALRQHVLDDFLADYSQQEATDDARVLTLFGLLDPGLDLWNLYLELYAEQIAGYYDDETQQMYIVRGEGFEGPERLTYAHEYVHALQDQNYHLEEGLGYSDEACESDSERCAAIQSLIEGDASFLEAQWLRTFATQEDIQQITDFYGSLQSPVFNSAPAFLQQSFVFPYTQGFIFVSQSYRDGDWAAVDAVYADPPLSTEQILQPERYPDDRPVRLQAPDLSTTLGGDWRQIDSDVLGEMYLRLMLEERLSEPEVSTAAEGWGGDYYVALFNEQAGEGALVSVTSWDTLADAEEFFLTFREYGDVRFGGAVSFTPLAATWAGEGLYALSERHSDQTLWILAPDEATAQRLRQAVVFPAEIP
jgi:hypothetical protein